MTPANKDEDDGHNILVPIKEEPIDDDDNHLLAATPDQPADKPCIPTSNTKSEQESSPVSQLTHMDTEDYTFDNIEPLPYNDDEQIALHGCLGNHFVDLMNSPTHPPSIGTEKAIAFEDLPDLPDIEAISAASPHLFPFYPPHWPSYQGLPHTYHASRNFGYSQTDDHSPRLVFDQNYPTTRLLHHMDVVSQILSETQQKSKRSFQYPRTTMFCVVAVERLTTILVTNAFATSSMS